MTNRQTTQSMAARAHDWAMKEMHFQNQGCHINKPLPTVQDFSEIFKGEMAEIWKFVVENVYSAQTVRKVRGNLLLKQREMLPLSSAYTVKYGSNEHYSQEKTDLLERRRALIQEITAERANIARLDKDLKQTHTEAANAETNYRSATSQLHESRCKAAILKAHSEHNMEEVEKIKEYSDRVKHHVKRLKDTSMITSQDEQYYSRSSTSSETGAGLESAATKEIRQCCESIAEFLQKMLQGTFGTDMSVVGQHRESLWKKVEVIGGNHSPNQIMMSLSIITQDTTYDLKEKTAKIDIRRDAEKLRFKYEGVGNLSDMSPQPCLLRSVHQLLEESQAAQIQSFFETERSRNKTASLQKRISQSQQLVSDWLTQYYRNDEQGLRLAKLLFDMEIQVSSTRAALRTLEATAETLKNKINLALCEKETLYTKYQNIQDFKKLADIKQNQIRVLVRQSINSRQKLESQQLEIQQYILRTFRDQDEQTKLIASELHDSVVHNVDAFSLLSINSLMFTMIDSTYKVAVVDLSIYRLTANQNSPAGHMIKSLLHTLEFPPYKSPENLLSRVVALQTEVEDIRMSLKTYSTSPHSDAALVQRLSDACTEVTAHDQRQLQKLLPALQRRLTDISQALSDCLKVKDSVMEWWEQPAQCTTPWLKVDDKTFQQWRDIWTVTVTRLRQAQIR